MPTYYADDYEEITGLTRDANPEPEADANVVTGPEVQVVAKVITSPEVVTPEPSPVVVATEATPTPADPAPAPPAV